VFDVDELISDCAGALGEAEPRLAISEILQRAVGDPAAVERALPPTHAEITPIHVQPALTILKVVWAPGMTFPAHNHLMWAAIGLYGGQEDNAFFRRARAGLVSSGGRELRTGDVLLLGDDTIHKVTNPLGVFTGAIHVYGGDLPAQQGRSEWDDETGVELPYDFDRTVRYFEEANQS
jgi:predicted metal-dependent enzyme (double-stranded beta helix superfamily)